MFRTILIKFPENFHSSILVLLAPNLFPSFDEVRERFPQKKEHFHDICHKAFPPLIAFFSFHVLPYFLQLYLVYNERPSKLTCLDWSDRWLSTSSISSHIHSHLKNQKKIMVSCALCAFCNATVRVSFSLTLWDRAPDPLQSLYKSNSMVRIFRIVTQWWTLSESHLLRLYFGLFRPSPQLPYMYIT